METSKDPKTALKFTFCILPDLYSSNVWIFLGGEIQRNLYYNNFSRLYGLIGAGYDGLSILCGTAIGYELFTGKPGVAINLDLGISFMKGVPNPHGDAGSELEIAPGIGLGLSYAY